MLLDIQKEAIIKHILPLIPTNKRGFSSKQDPLMIIQCIIHKLKTGCQWRLIFLNIGGVTYPFSHELVYYYYRKWLIAGVFKKSLEALQKEEREKIDTRNIYIDGTHSLTKKGAKPSGIRDENGLELLIFLRS